MALWNQITGNLFAVAVALTAVFLVVGGIVIMNIMLASVTERTREIGLRRSLGARRKHIVLQFMTESAVLAAVGGIMGLTLAYGIVALVRAVTPIPVKTPLSAVIIFAPDVSAAVGGPFFFLEFILPCVRRSWILSKKRFARGRLNIIMAHSHTENLKRNMDALRTPLVAAATYTYSGVGARCQCHHAGCCAHHRVRRNYPGKHQAVWRRHRFRFPLGSGSPRQHSAARERLRKPLFLARRIAQPKDGCPAIPLSIACFNLVRSKLHNCTPDRME